MANWLKTSQIKQGEKMVFQPLTKEGVEKFTLWDVKNKKFLREGESLKTAKGIQEVNKFIKLTDEEKKSYGRNFKINRKVVYDGKAYNIDLPQSVDTALKQQMQSIEEDKGENPLEYNYVLKREGEGLRTTYFVMSGKNVGLPSVKPEEADEASSSFSNNEMKEPNNTLQDRFPIYFTPKNMEVIKAIQEQGITDQSDAFRIMKKYGFGTELANEALKRYFGDG